MWRKYKCYARENVDCSKEKMSVWNRKEVFMFNVKMCIRDRLYSVGIITLSDKGSEGLREDVYKRQY